MMLKRLAWLAEIWWLVSNFFFLSQTGLNCPRFLSCGGHCKSDIYQLKPQNAEEMKGSILQFICGISMQAVMEKKKQSLIYMESVLTGAVVLLSQIIFH